MKKYKLLQEAFTNGLKFPIGTIILLSEEGAKIGIEQNVFEEVEEEKSMRPSDWIEKEASEMLEINMSNPTLREQNIAYVNSIILLLDLLHMSGQIKLPDINNKDL